MTQAIDIIKRLCYALGLMLTDIAEHGKVLPATIPEAQEILKSSQEYIISHNTKPQAHLDNWLYSDGRLWGEVKSHPNPKLVDGSSIHTSTVLNIDFVNNIAETKNTIYTLGKPQYQPNAVFTPPKYDKLYYNTVNSMKPSDD